MAEDRKPQGPSSMPRPAREGAPKPSGDRDENERFAEWHVQTAPPKPAGPRFEYLRDGQYRTGRRPPVDKKPGR